MDRLPAWLKNKWVLFALSAAATLLICLLIFLLFLRGPFASMFTRQGDSALADADYEKAANRYSLALGLKKDREEIYLGYSKALTALKNYDEAADLLSKGIRKISGSEDLYLAQVQILVAAGRIGDAVDFLDSIEDSYINKKIQDKRPGDLSYSPAQGSYSTAQKITLTPREGETIYYTLTGEDPTLKSQVYKEPFTVNSNVTLTAIAVSSGGLVSPRLELTYEINNANEAITFTDKKIERMVRASLNKPSGSIYAAQLAGITDLGNEEIDGNIRSLKDLEYMPSLSALRLDDEMLIEDYTPLSGLTSLTYLSLSGCALSDADLEVLTSCTALVQLVLDRNQITDLTTLDSLAFLEYLSLAENDIASSHAIPTYELLDYLNLASNQLTEAEGLSALKRLTGLDLSGNSISDLSPLAELEGLIELYLKGNAPSNLKKLSKLPQLVSLDISDCGLASLSVLNDYKKLTVVRADDNQIASLSTFTLPVEELYISRNPLADISSLKAQTGLVYLEAIGTQISDISFLSGFKKLTYLDISDTLVTDATALKNCPELTFLRCPEGCKTEGIPSTVEIVH